MCPLLFICKYIFVHKHQLNINTSYNPTITRHSFFLFLCERIPKANRQRLLSAHYMLKTTAKTSKRLLFSDSWSPECLCSQVKR